MCESFWHDYLNSHGERIQNVGNIALNLDYWDCECKYNYLHRIAQKTCSVCLATQKESPSSIEFEVQKHVHNLNLGNYIPDYAQ